MNIVETILVFAGIPIGIASLLAVAVYGKTLVSSPNRYRPGRPWTHPPVWYLPHPEGSPVLPSAHAVAALTAGSARPAPDDTERMGGASGEW